MNKEYHWWVVVLGSGVSGLLSGLLIQSTTTFIPLTIWAVITFYSLKRIRELTEKEESS